MQTENKNKELTEINVFLFEQWEPHAVTISAIIKYINGDNSILYLFSKVTKKNRIQFQTQSIIPPTNVSSFQTDIFVFDSEKSVNSAIYKKLSCVNLAK